MSRDDWYRNTTWSPEIEEAFFAKLRRARGKSQYLRIQACELAERSPEVALRLLDEFFKLGVNFDFAQAHLDRATAHLALGNIEEAICSLKAAMAREAEYPNLLTQAYLDYPQLVATYRLTAQYQEAIEVLMAHRDRPSLATDHFLWHGSLALLLKEVGDLDQAKAHAASALEAAAQTHSGFRYHPKAGLVSERHANLRATLERIAS